MSIAIIIAISFIFGFLARGLIESAMVRVTLKILGTAAGAKKINAALAEMAASEGEKRP